MPNKQYEKGARFERDIVNKARAEGKWAARTASSKSKIDCFTIDFKNKIIEFIQAKTGKSKMTKKQTEEFEGKSDEYLVKFRVMQKA